MKGWGYRLSSPLRKSRQNSFLEFNGFFLVKVRKYFGSYEENCIVYVIFLLDS
ncbi:TPA: hypothetical protein R1934_001219 [Staphylococcus delphini]|nr:hypothetical protein [Staphylococcus delphini]